MNQADPISAAFLLPGIMIAALAVGISVVGYVFAGAVRRNRPEDRDAGSAIAVLVDASLWLLVCLLLYFLVPKFVKVFQDFDAELPAITLQMIGLSNVVVRFFYLIPLLVIAGAVIDWFARKWIVRSGPVLSRSGLLLWTLLMVFTPLGLIGWIWLANYLPLADLIKKLS